jgi:hypothetical protein
MKTFMMAVLAIAAFAAVAVAADKPDFSGSWKLDADKSNLGPMPPPTSLTRKVDHKEPAVTVDTAQSGPQGDISTTFKYATDGKETTNSFMGSDLKCTAAWEGKTLVINSKGEFGGSEVKLVSKWTLSDDGKTLTDASHITMAQGEIDITYVLAKQ